MFNIPNTMAITSYTADAYFNPVTEGDKPTLIPYLSSVKNVPTEAFKPNNASQCVVLDNLHIPQNALSSDIEGYNKGLQDRINHDYAPQGSTVFLLGTPNILEDGKSLSLPVYPSALIQKLLSISNKKECEFKVQANGYV